MAVLSSLIWLYVTLFALTESCEVINVSYCNSFGYNFTSYPTLNGLEDQAQASQELKDFIPHIEENCSNVTLLFLCSYYFPFCSYHNNNSISLQPCRNLCTAVYNDCYPLFLRRNLSWPDHLNCSKFMPHDTKMCFGPDNPSTVYYPDIKTTHTSFSTDIGTFSTIMETSVHDTTKIITTSKVISTSSYVISTSSYVMSTDVSSITSSSSTVLVTQFVMPSLSSSNEFSFSSLPSETSSPTSGNMFLFANTLTIVILFTSVLLLVVF